MKRIALGDKGTVRIFSPEDIARTIDQHFNPPPAKQAALELFNKGIRNKDINIREICSKIPYPPEPQVLAVCNALRDLERKTNEGYVYHTSPIHNRNHQS